ncbi:MAG: tRNA (adenosine(37)-N6)-threonylcarbamoyltransferase complex ATPase subunit type 1 TsaE, partial [Candidatus Krumholzibacteria bacterium]|nr:tRNA (adenosine(37)-N6)-threonylcarbamoyltransferase complex ATPase subunit type 1 TsaE [Candidatus Krumholzibacteria bacterium]
MRSAAPEGGRVARSFESPSPGRTRLIGEAIGRLLGAGAAVSLEGGLGAGKTCLAGGILRGLGVEEDALSPTFVLVEEYRGRDRPVLHCDLYRLDELGEAESIGLFDAVDGNNIVIVEWGDRLPGEALDFDLRIS